VRILNECFTGCCEKQELISHGQGWSLLSLSFVVVGGDVVESEE
jgi:hypothetical protein